MPTIIQADRYVEPAPIEISSNIPDYENVWDRIKDANSLEDSLFNEISKVKLGSVTNVSDHWIMINLKGKKIFELLSAGCPFNFNNFKNSKGAVTQTLLNHIDVIIHNKNVNDLNDNERKFLKSLPKKIDDNHELHLGKYGLYLKNININNNNNIKLDKKKWDSYIN